MAFLNDKKYSFMSQGLPDDTFGVVNFKGSEGLSTCYQFDISLVSEKQDLDPVQVLSQPCTFVIHREEGEVPFHGIPALFEMRQAFNEYIVYRAVLAPKLWWLSLTHHNQVFLDQTIPEIIQAVLQDGGLTENDYELRLEQQYPQWEYICQYRESHLNFVSRWMEREGMYYFFEQTPGGEKVVITDTNLAHTAMPDGTDAIYSPPSGLDAAHREEVIQSLVYSVQMLPLNVQVKDYNYRTPSIDLSGRADVLPDSGRGEFYVYGDHFRTPEEGDHLAGIRAESMLSRQKIITGESTIPYVRPGYTFNLKEHFKGDLNQKYLTIDMRHEGSQTGYLVAGLKEALSQADETVYYRNTFNAIPSSTQFRAEHKTPKARLYGTMNAAVDGSGSGQYAELDHEGRYKVILPFDLSGRKGGKASAWVRMMQPYGGSNHGMHFPLHKGTEVLLTFIDGDPDRPIISGAVPNPEHPSPVKDGNETMNMITTGGGNKIHIEDKENSQRILLQSPTEDTFFRMGAVNDPISDMWEEEDGCKIYTNGWLSVRANCENTVLLGESTKTVGGASMLTTVGVDIKNVLGLALLLKMGGTAEFTPHHTCLHGDSKRIKGELTELHGNVSTLAGETTKLAGQTSKLAGETTKLASDATTLYNTTKLLATETTKLAAEVTNLSGDVTNLKGEETNTVGEKTAAIGENTKVIAEFSQICGSMTKSIGESTKMVADETKLIAESSELCGMKQIL